MVGFSTVEMRSCLRTCSMSWSVTCAGPFRVSGSVAEGSWPRARRRFVAEQILRSIASSSGSIGAGDGSLVLAVLGALLRRTSAVELYFLPRDASPAPVHPHQQTPAAVITNTMAQHHLLGCRGDTDGIVCDEPSAAIGMASLLRRSL